MSSCFDKKNNKNKKWKQSEKEKKTYHLILAILISMHWCMYQVEDNKRYKPVILFNKNNLPSIFLEGCLLYKTKALFSHS